MVVDSQAERWDLGLRLISSHIVFVRKKRLTGWKQGHTPGSVFGAPAFGGGFFLAVGQCSGSWSRLSPEQKEGRPSRWKDGLTRSFVHRSTHHF